MGRNHNRKVRNGSIDYVQVPALMCTSTGYGEQTISKNRREDITIAKVAQLVEHNLAKVGVAGSNPVFRSIGLVVQLVRIHACHAWGRGFESRPDRNE